jgi:hypothetical protein
MKRMSCAFCVIAVLTVMMSVSALAGSTTGPMKWSQPIVQIGVVPDPFGNQPLYTGWDEPSYTNQVPPGGNPPLVADDWLCRNNLPVTDIHWWGSYLGSTSPAPPIPVTGFTFNIYNDVPASPNNPFSHPGSVVWSYTTNSFKEVFVGYDGTIDAAGGIQITDSTFQYNVNIDPALWFFQKPDPGANNIYWLSIQAIVPAGAFNEWGWKTRPHSFQDDATRLLATTAGWQPIIGTDGNSWDMAFELSTVPEPGSLLALATGLVGFAGFSLRRRR